MVEIIKKISSEMFEAIKSGKKNFEVRLEDDCKFNEGDILILKEHDENREFTGRELRKEIGFIWRSKERKMWSDEDILKYGIVVLDLK